MNRKIPMKKKYLNVCFSNTIYRRSVCCSEQPDLQKYRKYYEHLKDFFLKIIIHICRYTNPLSLDCAGNQTVAKLEHHVEMFQLNVSISVVIFCIMNYIFHRLLFPKCYVMRDNHRLILIGRR